MIRSAVIFCPKCSEGDTSSLLSPMSLLYFRPARRDAPAGPEREQLAVRWLLRYRCGLCGYSEITP